MTQPNRSPSRRSFLQAAGLGAAAAGTRFLLPVRGALAAPPNASDKLRVAVIGCGGQGVGTHVRPAASERLVALVDPDPKKIGNAVKKAQSVDPNYGESNVKAFDDYRKLFDSMGKELDAILVATPNHHHALPAMIAMTLGISAYVEKPLCHDIHEARTLSALSKKHKVATQMGNQGHSGEGYRSLCEFIWAGAIGNVTEVYCWSDRANGGTGPRPPAEPPPAGMNWDHWIGPAPYRDFHKDLHPHEWHGWHDFGNGSLGNMACHVMDGAHWALKLGHPTSIEVEDMLGGSDQRYPVGVRIRWDFPAREGMPPVKVWWYDGRKRGAKAGKGDEIDNVDKKSRNKPPVVAELEKKYNRDFGSNGSIFIGDKGIMCAGTYGAGVRIVPEEAHKAYTAPPKTLPRTKGGHHGDFFNAIRTGGTACSNFETASKLTEMILLGCVAMQVGPNKKLQWDGQAVKFPNMPEANKYLSRPYRQGWNFIEA